MGRASVTRGPQCSHHRTSFSHLTAPLRKHHARLRYALRHAPIGERDLLIAAIALANRLVVVTHNVKEFSRVPDLVVEDWARASHALE